MFAFRLTVDEWAMFQEVAKAGGHDTVELAIEATVARLLRLNKAATDYLRTFAGEKE